MRYLGLDLGKKRTGVAFADSEDDIIFSLDTFETGSIENLVSSVERLVVEKSIEEIVVGLPLLPSGELGSQAQWVQTIVQALQKGKTPVSVVDERYTTGTSSEIDQDAAAACKILGIKLDQK